MIQAEQLRFGNKIFVGSKVCTVLELCNDDVRTDEYGYVNYTHKDINYIPISPEWLERAGFESSLNQICMEYTLGGFTIYEQDDCFGVSLNGNDVEFRFVHDLQNCFFAVKRKELEFK